MDGAIQSVLQIRQTLDRSRVLPANNAGGPGMTTALAGMRIHGAVTGRFQTA
jgi:hypothetical protein